MLLRKAYQFKLKPDGASCRKLAQFCGCTRFVYNKGLVWNKESYEKDKNFKLSYAGLCALLPGWKKELPWLGKCHSQVLQQAMKDLMRSFENFWEGRTDFPKFHKKFKTQDSFRYPQGFKINEVRKQVFLPMIGWVNYRRSRYIQGKPRNITVSRKADGWYFSIRTEREIGNPVHPKSGVEVGIDVGVVHTVTLSDDTPPVEPINAFRTKQKKLAHAQRKLKRMTKFGKNWRKLQKKIALLHKHIADCRRDHLRKAAGNICKNHAVVYREALKIKNMAASAKGTAEEPGKNVSQKSGLNKAILDQGWAMFFAMLDEYMKEWGGEVYAVPPAYTSQTCPHCNHVSAASRPAQALFHCENCGYEGNADRVAAVNLLRRGQRLRACGELRSTAEAPVRRPSRKRRVVQQQEPIEEIAEQHNAASQLSRESPPFRTERMSTEGAPPSSQDEGFRTLMNL